MLHCKIGAIDERQFLLTALRGSRAASPPLAPFNPAAGAELTLGPATIDTTEFSICRLFHQKKYGMTAGISLDMKDSPEMAP